MIALAIGGTEMRARWGRVIAALLVLGMAAPAVGQGSFVNFESGHTRPLAMSPDGNRLFAVNTPDNRLAIYDITAGGLTLVAEVPVGMEPVAVATRVNGSGRTEAWVVNHLSDSVSIVEVHPSDVSQSRVVRTLLVGDEPRDIVFAGTGFSRAFITTARRGQNVPGSMPANLTTEGIGRALVWAYDANNLGAALGGTPLSITACFTDTPRGLAVSPDGTRVYAGGFHSGNRTTAILEALVTPNGGNPPPPPGATANPPDVGLIVKFNPANNRWEDEIGRNWNSQVALTLPDQDVFIINATANPPALAAAPNAVVGVGTILFNLAVRPDNGRIYVGNLESRNHVRFEPLAAGGVQGNIAQSRITVINGTTPTARHLNPHINYAVTTGSQAERDQSLAFPMDMVFTPDGQTVFVTAFGSAKIAALDTDDLEAGTITAHRVTVGQGPSGLALDVTRNRLYVMNRIDHTISIISNADSGSRAQTGVVSLHFDPSPPIAKLGRRFLYDALDTSGHGDSACASCHIFGDFDSLAWDLGDPFGEIVANPNPFRVGSGGPFHPMKGPMTTQSQRGMADLGPMHWRGDRTGGTEGGNPLDEDLAFKAFNPAFVGLLGRAAELTATQMQQFTDFILTVRYPPNPIRALDNVPTSGQAAAQTFFLEEPSDAGVITCNQCHQLPAGADGFSSFEGETQEFKIAHLRNGYQKVGMFGLPSGVLGGTGNLGDQVRGFGFLHDGSIPTIFNFLRSSVFQIPNDTMRRNLENFSLSLDTGLRPIVGQQVSANSATFSNSTVITRIDLLIARDDAGDCELVVKGVAGGEARGWRYAGGNNFQGDRAADPLIDKTSLRTLAGTAGQEQTYTCVPPGGGVRIGIDRDGDNAFDGDEIDAGSDPGDPNSLPPSAPTPTATFTNTPTGVPTATATATITATATGSATRTPTVTATPTASNTPTAVPGTPTATRTVTVTRTATSTFTATATRTPTGTTTATGSATPTATNTPLVVCNGSLVIQKAKLKVSRNLAPAGDERLTLKGELQLPSLIPTIDPIANGFTFAILDRATDQLLVTRTVPGGAGEPGWSGSAPRWKFKDRDGALAGGVIKAQVKDRSSRTPGLFQFRVLGKDADFTLPTDNLELVVILGGTTQGAGGQCARLDFNPGGTPDPACAAVGSTIKCD